MSCCEIKKLPGEHLHSVSCHEVQRLRCDVCAGGTPRRQTVTVQRPAEQSFSQQFVRPQQLLEGKVKTLFTSFKTFNSSRILKTFFYLTTTNVSMLNKTSLQLLCHLMTVEHRCVCAAGR